MTLWDYLPQRHRLLPYWIASMHASISKSDMRNAQRTPFGRFRHLRRRSPSVLDLEMPKKRWYFLLCCFFALLMHCATTPSGVQVTTCTLSKPYHPHTLSNVVIHSIRDTYIL